MERSLKEHKDYIIEVQEKNVKQIVHYKRVLGELWRDKEDWKAQCLARQLYIKHMIKQIYKAHEMLDKAKNFIEISSLWEGMENNY